MSAIPFNDLSRLTKLHQSAFLEAFQRVLGRSYYVLGPEVKAFEEEFAAYCGASSCVSLANGTDAIEIGLRALGVGAGDLVATVSNAGGYSTTAIRSLGAFPQYVEIEPDTMLMSAESLEAVAKRGNLKAVVVTHLYGLLADMPLLLAVARKHGVAVLEDVAQAHGAVRADKRAGTWGDAAAFSFYPTKNLGALGDGGAVVTSRQDVEQTIRELRQYGWRTKYHADRSGGRNSRLDEIQAALLRVQLPTLDSRNDRRRAILKRYQEGLRLLPLVLPVVDESHVGHLYVIRHHARTRLKQLLQDRGIGTDVHYPIPDQRQVAASSWLPAPLSLPVTEQAAAQVLSLPCFPELTDAEVDQVIQGVQSACSELSVASA